MSSSFNTAVPVALWKIPVRVSVLYSRRSAAMRLVPDVKTTLPVAMSLCVSVNSSTSSAANDWSPQSISTCPISLM